MSIRLGNISIGSQVAGSATRDSTTVTFLVTDWRNPPLPEALSVSILLEENLGNVGGAYGVVAKAVITGDNISSSAGTDIVAVDGVAGYDQTFGEPAIKWVVNDPEDDFTGPNLRAEHRSRNQGVGPRFTHVFRGNPSVEETHTIDVMVVYRGQIGTATVTVTVPAISWTDAETILIASDGDFSWYSGNVSNVAQTYDRPGPALNAQARINNIASDKARVLFKPGDTISETLCNWENNSLNKNVFIGTEWGQTPATIDLRGNQDPMIEFLGSEDVNENNGRQIVIQNFDVIGGTNPSTEEADPLGSANTFVRGGNGNGDVIIDRVHATGLFNFHGGANVGIVGGTNGHPARTILHDCRHDNSTDFFWIGGPMLQNIGISMVGCRTQKANDVLYGGQGRSTYPTGGLYDDRNAHDGIRHQVYRYANVQQTEFIGWHGWVITSPNAVKNNLPLLQNGIRYNTGSETGMQFQMTQCFNTLRIRSDTTSPAISGGDNRDPQRMHSLFEANTFISPPSAPFFFAIHHSGLVLKNNHFIVPDFTVKTVLTPHGLFGFDAQDFVNRVNMTGWPIRVWGNTFEFLKSQANIGDFNVNDIFAGIIQNDSNGFNDVNYRNLDVQDNVIHAPNITAASTADGPFTRSDTDMILDTLGVAFGWHVGIHTLTADVPDGGTFEVPYTGQTDTFGRPVSQADFSAYDNRAGFYYNGATSANYYGGSGAGEIDVAFTPTGIQFTNNTGITLVSGNRFDFNISRGANHEAPHPDTAVDHTAQNLVPQPSAGAYQSATGPDVPHWDMLGNVRGVAPSRGAFEAA